MLRAGVVGTRMTKFLYSAAMSLDGFIAGPGGDVSWMADHLGPNPVVDELIAQTGAILVGNRTFGGDDPYKGQEGEGEAFGGGWDGPQFVPTHRPPDELRPGRDVRRRYRDGYLRIALGCGRQVRQRPWRQRRRAVPRGRSARRGAGVRMLGDGTRLFEQPRGQYGAPQPDQCLAHASGDESPVSRHHRTARASACTPVTICDSLRLA